MIDLSRLGLFHVSGVAKMPRHFRGSGYQFVETVKRTGKPGENCICLLLQNLPRSMVKTKELKSVVNVM